MVSLLLIISNNILLKQYIYDSLQSNEMLVICIQVLSLRINITMMVDFMVDG